MKDYKTNFESAVEYGLSKGKMPWWKIMIMGVMGAIYVGLGYSGYIKIAAMFIESTGDHPYEITFMAGGLIVASAIFPVGLLLIIFLGGSLFTSDNLSMIGFLTKKASFRTLVRKWGLVLLANMIGGFFIAGIFRWSGAFNDADQQVIAWLIHKKTTDQWYSIIGSAAISNVLVAGTVWASLATSQSIGKIFIVFFPIWLFAITGFHHVVANGIIFAIGISYNDTMVTLVNDPYWISKAIYINFIPAGIGNWISGAIFLPVMYWLLIRYKPHHGNIFQSVGLYLGVGDSHGYCSECKTEQEELGIHVKLAHKNKGRWRIMSNAREKEKQKQVIVKSAESSKNQHQNK